LHHLTAFRQVLRVIVGGTDFVALGMGKLAFNDIRRKTIFVEDGTGSSTES